MAVIALAGVPGSPGVTATALALLRTWPLEDGWRLLLAECDPDGGAVLSGALEGRVPADRGLRYLAVSSRRQGQELVASFWTQLIAVDSRPGAERNRLLLPGLTDPCQASSLSPSGGSWPTCSRASNSTSTTSSLTSAAAAPSVPAVCWRRAPKPS